MNNELPHQQEGLFEEQLRGLVSLGDKVCESPVSAHSVYFIESTWKEQFKTYQDSILHSRKIALTAPIRRNKLQIYKDTKVKRKSARKLKVDHFKQQAEFFGKIFLTLESRDGDLKEFF